MVTHKLHNILSRTNYNFILYINYIYVIFVFYGNETQGQYKLHMGDRRNRTSNIYYTGPHSSPQALDLIGICNLKDHRRK